MSKQLLVVVVVNSIFRKEVVTTGLVKMSIITAATTNDSPVNSVVSKIGFAPAESQDRIGVICVEVQPSNSPVNVSIEDLMIKTEKYIPSIPIQSFRKTRYTPGVLQTGIATKSFECNSAA
jgi:hypothetical protein